MKDIFHDMADLFYKLIILLLLIATVTSIIMAISLPFAIALEMFNDYLRSLMKWQ